MQSPEKSSPESAGSDIARWVETASQQGDADHYAGKRQWTRFAEGMRLEVVVDPDRPAEVQGVYMHNVSDGGFAFWSKKEIRERSSLLVREFIEDEPQPWLKAKVTHCTRGLRGYLVGAYFVRPTAQP